MDHQHQGDRPGTDKETDGQWMTKAELAAVRRISVASADRLIRRQGWRKQPGNDGRARVLVPRSWLRTSEPARGSSPTDAPQPAPSDAPQSVPSDTHFRHVAALAEQAITILGEQVSRERVRADKAEAEAVRLASEVAQAGVTLTAATARTEAAEAARAAAEGNAQRMAEQLAAVQAEERRLRERENQRLQLGRWRRAWRGWCGR